MNRCTAQAAKGPEAALRLQRPLAAGNQVMSAEIASLMRRRQKPRLLPPAIK